MNNGNRLIGSTACSTCKFAVADAKGTLACRRMPPVAAPIIAQVKGELPRMVGQTSIFPQVHPAHWCGEFKLDLQREESLRGIYEEAHR